MRSWTRSLGNLHKNVTRMAPGEKPLVDLELVSEGLAAGHTTVDNLSSVDGRTGEKQNKAVYIEV